MFNFTLSIIIIKLRLLQGTKQCCPNNSVVIHFSDNFHVAIFLLSWIHFGLSSESMLWMCKTKPVSHWQKIFALQEQTSHLRLATTSLIHQSPIPKTQLSPGRHLSWLLNGRLPRHRWIRTRHCPWRSSPDPQPPQHQGWWSSQWSAVQSYHPPWFQNQHQNGWTISPQLSPCSQHLWLPLPHWSSASRPTLTAALHTQENVSETRFFKNIKNIKFSFSIFWNLTGKLGIWVLPILA